MAFAVCDRPATRSEMINETGQETDLLHKMEIKKLHLLPRAINS